MGVEQTQRCVEALATLVDRHSRIRAASRFYTERKRETMRYIFTEYHLPSPLQIPPCLFYLV